MPSFHYPYGASTMARTLACPPWRKAADRLPPPGESKYARLGTALHAAAEHCLMDDVEPADLIGQKFEGITITAAHIHDKLAPAVEAARSLMREHQITEYECEVPVEFTSDAGTTIDLIGSGDETVLILDFKFGDGIQVGVPEEGNAQLDFSEACAVASDVTYDLVQNRSFIVHAIVQPNSRGENTVRARVRDANRRKSMRRIFDSALKAARAADPDDPQQYQPGSHCRFCPVEAVCPAKLGLRKDMTRINTETVPMDQLGELLRMADDLEKQIAAARKFAHEQLERGDKIPGWKLVAKRATRRYTDEDAVEAKVKARRKLKHADTHKSVLLSPAQLEKVYAEKELDFAEIEDYISSVSSGTTLAPESDPRPAAPAIQALKQLANK
jgi:hypothetical protein